MKFWLFQCYNDKKTKVNMYKYKDIFYCDIKLTTEQEFEIQSLSIKLQSASKEQLLDLLLLNTKTLLLTNNRVQKMMSDLIKNQL